MRQKVHLHTQIFMRTESANINKYDQIVSFERSHKIFNKHSRYKLLLSDFRLLLFSAHLEVSSIDFVVLSSIFGLLPLSLNEF